MKHIQTEIVINASPDAVWGVLVPLLWKQLDSNTRNGFETMNRKLKERVESKVPV